MKHIAIDARVINSSTGTYVERLLHYLQKIDTINNYSVLVREKDRDYWKPSASNFTVRVADFENYSLNEQFGFKKYLEKLTPDLVHFCMPQQPIFYKGLHVTTIHDLTLLKKYSSDKNWFVFHFKQLIGRYVFKKVSKTSRYVITDSKYTETELLKFVKVSDKKIAVIPLAADVDINKLFPYKHPFKKFILYVGQQSNHKNIRRLGDAHQKLLQSYPDLGLILVGSLNSGAVRNKNYFDSKKYKNILFTGFLPDAERDWLYKNAVAYVFPSLMEGFGLPGLEAMAYGAPVISSNATCLPEIYEDAAHYFNPKNTGDMVRAINEVLSDEILRNNLIKKGYEQVPKYSWIRTARQTLSIYLGCLHRDNEE